MGTNGEPGGFPVILVDTLSGGALVGDGCLFVTIRAVKGFRDPFPLPLPKGHVGKQGGAIVPDLEASGRRAVRQERKGSTPSRDRRRIAQDRQAGFFVTRGGNRNPERTSSPADGAGAPGRGPGSREPRLLRIAPCGETGDRASRESCRDGDTACRGLFSGGQYGRVSIGLAKEATDHRSDSPFEHLLRQSERGLEDNDLCRVRQGVLHDFHGGIPDLPDL